jgi:glycosyltransferase involved in cell wall biosynthesis
MPLALEQLDLRGYDLIISSESGPAKGIIAPSDAVHVCYCHTPMRYAWDESFLRGESLGPIPPRLASAVTAWLRAVDRKRAVEPDVYVANSTFVAQRIREAYGRESEVIHPPVEIAPLLDVERDPGDAYLVFGRLVPYKRADLAIEACARLGRRLIVAGAGRDYERLRAGAPPAIEVLGEVAPDEVPGLFSRARGLLFPGLEDFGMVPVEAQAAGLPVIAFGAGGVRDSVIDGETGVLYEPGTVDGLCEAILRFESMSFEDRALRDNARRFAPDRFARAFADLLLALRVAGAPADNLRSR